MGLRGSMDLGFRFDEHKGAGPVRHAPGPLHLLRCQPAAVRAQNAVFYELSTVSLGHQVVAQPLGTPSPGSPSTHSNNPLESWKICSPGDNPQLVKTRLRHWAQVVACSVKHSS